MQASVLVYLDMAADCGFDEELTLLDSITQKLIVKMPVIIPNK